MLVQQVSIRPVSSGFDLYEVSEKGEVMDDADIFNCIGEYYEIGVDDLPEEIEDISGKIQNEPERIFALVENGSVTYFGLESVAIDFETSFEGVTFTATMYSDFIEFSANESELENFAIAIIDAHELVATDGWVDRIPEQRETIDSEWWKYANALAAWVSGLLKEYGIEYSAQAVIDALGSDCWEPYGTLKFIAD